MHTDTPTASWQLLRTMPALAHLDVERLRWLADRVQWRVLAAGEPVPCPFSDTRIHLLLSGQVQVCCANVQGRELLLGELLPGQMFGNALSCKAMPQGVRMEATQPTLLAVMEGQIVQEWLYHDSAMVLGILQNVTDLLWQLVARVVEMGTLNVRSRLHMRQLALAQRQGVEGNQVLLSPSPTQASLAAYLGTTREEVAREMSRLTRLGLLQRQGRSIFLSNLDGLLALVEAQ